LLTLNFALTIVNIVLPGIIIGFAVFRLLRVSFDAGYLISFFGVFLLTMLLHLISHSFCATYATFTFLVSLITIPLGRKIAVKSKAKTHS